MSMHLDNQRWHQNNNQGNQFHLFCFVLFCFMVLYILMVCQHNNQVKGLSINNLGFVILNMIP
jgi:hypothetical protein